MTTTRQPRVRIGAVRRALMSAGLRVVRFKQRRSAVHGLLTLALNKLDPAHPGNALRALERELERITGGACPPPVRTRGEYRPPSGRPGRTDAGGARG